MILFLLIVLTLITYLGSVYLKNRRASLWIRWVGNLCLVVVLALLVLNDSFHLGMKTITTKQTTAIESVSSQANLSMLMYKPVGTKGTEKVYLYKTNHSQKVQTLTPEQATTKVVQTKGKPKLVQKKQQWVYQNVAMKQLFGVLGNDHRRIKTQNTLYVKNDWLVLSTKQAKILQKKLANKQIQARLQQQIKQKVTVKMAQMSKEQLTPQQQVRQIHRLTQQVQKQALESLLK
ncbi:DUF4811 domain-containing protein [Bombilactobacillus folatiphilus]|uniref:DUF4811 domain-containing protein n=1 Tax=Bombilactobacillus folatiphilus TaxID=2923362 RepID=A0ABY4P9J2_9LACO|nr:DUF4811 domain-containing protein [Bombilactobacillus folatiphilus]UQS82297.1 DUF4811 domain-containing protein [Bombilactobacillus folatiphilus]